MAKKLGPPIALGIITILAIFFITSTDRGDTEILKSTFMIEAIYFNETNSDIAPDPYIQINFKDNSGKTKAVVLEVLGMEESFQKTYIDSEFSEIISFPIPPKYGWEIHPVTLQIDHEDLGMVSMKTEIRPNGESPAPIIYGNP